MKRKPRKKLVKDKTIDIMKPIQFDKLGTDDDPCFGKHHDPLNSDCGVCGDAEICSIVCGQKAHLTRAKIEAEQPMKDIQNLTCTWKDVLIASRKLLRNKYKDGLPLPSLKTKVIKKLNIHEAEFDKLIRTASIKQPKLKIDSKTKLVTYQND